MDVLSKIRTLMRKNNWSEYQLAKVSGVSQSTINSMFRKNNLPTIPTLESLCTAFKITLSEFFATGETIYDLTHEQVEMFNKLTSLSVEQKEAIINLINVMN